MVDYYSILLRAVTAPDAGDATWRRSVYDRARQMLASQIRARRPASTMAELAAEQADLEAAIERIESELSWTERGTNDVADVTPIAADRGPILDRTRRSGPAWIVAAIVTAAVGAGGYIYWTGASHKAPPPQVLNREMRSSAPTVHTAKNGEVAPGVDGGSSDADLSYVFRRQPTFYRTLQPVGTIIVDKGQHFLYLIQPNNVALRYGIALGEQCADVAGIRHIASMAEWPPWQPPPDLLKHNPAAMPGGPGNPLGARLLQLDDNSSRIHGTNAPRTIGNTVAFGCIRLINDDIVDLYGRVRVSTPVVMN